MNEIENIKLWFSGREGTAQLSLRRITDSVYAIHMHSSNENILVAADRILEAISVSCADAAKLFSICTWLSNQIGLDFIDRGRFQVLLRKHWISVLRGNLLPNAGYTRKEAWEFFNADGQTVSVEWRKHSGWTPNERVKRESFSCAQFVFLDDKLEISEYMKHYRIAWEDISHLTIQSRFPLNRIRMSNPMPISA